jgi:hypothetical protein
MDDATRAELAARWAYRAGLEHAAAARFEQLAHRMEACKMASELVAIARLATTQERDHVKLCTAISERFGGVLELPRDPEVRELAPRAFAQRDRVVYELVAFCCITETANAVVVTAGIDEVDDTAIRRAVRTILADEVQHSRLGWRFLATHPIDDAQRAWLGGHLPDMLAGTVREDLFKPAPIIGDEVTMARHGTLPIAGRREAFLAGMREVVLPGLDELGIDTSTGARFLDELERSAARLPS